MQEMDKSRKVTATAGEEQRGVVVDGGIAQGQLLEQAAKTVSVPVVQVSEPLPPAQRGALGSRRVTTRRPIFWRCTL